MNYKILFDKFVKEYGRNERLIYAVYDQLGCNNPEEFFQHCKDCLTPGGCGANAGFTGFIYYTETGEFFQKHKEEIMKLANDECEEFGYSGIIEMVENFNGMGSVTEEEIARTLYSIPDQADQYVADTMAKYAFEEVANWAENFMNQEVQDDKK